VWHGSWSFPFSHFRSTRGRRWKQPRFGLLAGRKDLVGRIRVKGFEFGMEARQMLYPAVARTLEQYDPGRVRALIATTKQITGELRPLLGNRSLAEAVPMIAVGRR
jgi:L-seryl-tRNA(Ser) seleniumtransferase